MTFVASLLVVLSTLPALEAVAAPAAYAAQRAQKEPLVAGHLQPDPSGASGRLVAQQFQPKAVVWPEPSSVDVVLPAVESRARGVGGPVKAGGLPVLVDPSGSAADAPARVRVESLDRTATKAAGVNGLLMRVSRSDGKTVKGSTRVTVDYNSFRHAYGGDWAARLRLQVLPECALTSPSAAACQGTELSTDNDPKVGTASAVVDLAGSARTASSLVALTAAASGGSGNYAATSLAPSATWSAGGNAGDFGWSYPLRMPPGLGGPAPSIALSYSSSSVDGRMASTNNQPSWIGEGFDWQPGSIERRYNSCAEDMGSGANNTVKTGDQCWETDNASLSLDGHAGELIKDPSNPNRWHLRADDGTFVERKTGVANGDNDGEWWVATTPDGTQYRFGARADSNATLQVPVFGNNAGEPCHQAAFANSSCTQAYKWQLDEVVDTHGNTMTYNYAKEINRYGRNNVSTDAVPYDRGGYLTEINYGTRVGSAVKGPMRVVFGVQDRCLSGCSAKDAHWPDVPWDQECSASPCKPEQNGPSFWTTKRLASVATFVGNDVPVETWTLTHSFPDPVDSITPALWLDKISHSGVGTVAGVPTPSITLPDVTFSPVMMPNRVDTNSDQFAAMKKARIQTVTSESGGKVDVTYSAPDCVKGTRMPDQNALQNNTLLCYPVKWTPSGHTTPINDFFHKYVVKKVVEADLTGSSTQVVTEYEYLGDPAWHYSDEDGFVKEADKTWAGWRGYGAVRTTKGEGSERTRAETRYFRGMNGDKLPSGTRSVSLPAIAIGSVPAVVDDDAYSGMVRESIVYNGPDGAEVSATASEPWQSAPTATRTLNGVTVTAKFAAMAVEHTRTALDGGRAPRTTTVATTFDEYGMPSQVEDRGDDAVTGDELCTLTTYARNTTTWILATTSRTRSFAVNCATANGGGLTDAQVTGDTRTWYDGQAWNVAPTIGDVTQSESLKEYNSGSPTYVTESRATYDAYGRVLDDWDVRGNKTTTVYTPSTGGPLTATSVTSPLGWVKSTTFAPAWGLPVVTTDANARDINMGYDALGRLIRVWMPGRDTGQSPNIKYEYLIRNNAPSVVTTQRLNPDGGYITSYLFHDSLMRQRQTQTLDAAGGTGAVVTDTYYDSAGRAFKTHDSYMAGNAQLEPVPPSTTMFLPSATIPSQKLMLFDGAGRETAQIHQVDAAPASPGATERWRTTTAYGGDRTDTIPPQGDTATSTITDGNGRTIETRQYHLGVTPTVNAPVTGYDATKYEYNRKDQLTKVTDPAGRIWTYAYDLRGNNTTTGDPDKGTTTTVYGDNGDIVSSTDGRGVTIAYKYDQVGRKESLHDGSLAGPKRAAWFYDVLSNGTPVTGQLVKTIRYVGTDEYIKENVTTTADYKPIIVKYTINAADTSLNGSYQYSYTYRQDGSPSNTVMPAIGGVPLETLTQTYDALGQVKQLNTSSGFGSTYVTGTDYTSYGEVGAIHLQNTGGLQVDIARTYQTDTRRLDQIFTTRQTAPTTVADVRYKYDPAGNVTSIADLTAGDTQCFTTDYLQRLTEAWTPTNSDCQAAAPSVAGLGGPASYWQSYSYDVSGNRTQLVQHGTPTGDRTTNYVINAANHRLTNRSTTDNSGTSTAAYTFDSSGNTLTRPTPNAGTQTLTWDPEGHLATSTDTTGGTSYIYDVDGNRLVRIDPTGKTLYLPGQELRYTAASTAKTGTRYYTHAGQTIATRTSSSVSTLVWLGGDQHGTANISIKQVAGQATAIRRETPFGEIRNTTGTWPASMDKGFVGGTNDNTGLTHLGAREYDPVIGRFISVDPVIDNADPQQMNGYSYANNNPCTASDPDGQWPKWADKVANKISNAASTATKTMTTAVSTAGKWAYDNAGTISTVLSVAATACAVIPPLQAIAPILAAGAAVAGAVDTYKSCASGATLDCATGIAGMIPGGRLLGAVGKGAKNAEKALDAADEVGDATRAARKGANAAGDACLTNIPNPGHSFDPATQVLMADGTSKAIGSIEIGDQVVATDPLTGETATRPVTDLHLNDDKDLTDVSLSIDPNPAIAGDETTETLKTTAHHPFWDLTDRAWIRAGDLVPGHQLRDLDGSPVTITALTNHVGQRWMNDLTVAEIHTYYVIAGTTPVLVHNCNLTITQEQLDMMTPGRFARWPGIRTKQGDPLSQEIRDAVQGDPCHSCGGSRPGAKPVKIGDHQPPKAFGLPGFLYRIFAHCSVCSRIQNTGVSRILQIGRNHDIYEPQGRYDDLMREAKRHVK